MTLPVRRSGAARSRLVGSLCAGSLVALLGFGMAGAGAPAAVAAEEPDGFYSSKQPYVEPTAAEIAAYSAAPEGYEVTFSESVARHGSRGLSSYKYDLLLQRLAETASADGGFVSETARDAFLADLAAMTAANVENGYGQLTEQGAQQHQGIGARAYERNAALYDRAVAAGDAIVVESSGESRATESGESFVAGFTGAAGAAAGEIVKPVVASPETLYFHKVENPDGTEKTGDALANAEAYEAYVDEQTEDGGTIAAAMEFIESLPEIEEAADDLLSGIFTRDFIDSIGDDGHVWFSTADGTEAGGQACAPGADPTRDDDACGDTDNSIESAVDAALTLYNLYIIAADMEGENVAPHAFDFAAYFAGRERDAEWFAYLLDAEDFYEKGPSVTGHDDTYAVAQPLLDDFIAAIDDRVAGGDTAAVFRFAHAETIVPFAALLHLPGSTRQAPDIADPRTIDEVFSYADNDWRGQSVTPMAQNVQWDVATRAGTDPQTDAAYEPVVRMLYNERETAFADSCEPVAAGSSWYALSEVTDCLGAAAADGAAAAGAEGADAASGSIVPAFIVGGVVVLGAVAAAAVVRSRRRA